ncbi:hypothetical protein Gbro_3125 [Gordonia bronchialis DSM 43247]|uniref:Uncharacterized protein n=1 Tax=Gordonia bronchialis (strain ATCC 25592 / DSM 43247 / BCRC 13721 / JCM 3198 / KCTC 3076 / NBRC 16047 / NCTC 10667) TaxID=526226 RepID=D0LBU4_GORB4|nr:DUF6345 domain-containing protein [Gordonia bronchialis]ACY22331.1 hypothetical protein Gbro_3125 [Gordonia bronchialis DSM 43247]MCC3325121.1 DUF6345 domain-containing protein [Gordonia bronchialis]QGS24141.1 hypothetical protein FOB84_08155 [Gordonia bronchialis]STQ65257.1 Uncharacterised protein [Gordonia bronchialis]
MTTTAEPTAGHNPFGPAEDAPRQAATKAANVHGECSIQTFSSAGSLGQTHADAQGFTDYLNVFSPGNFRYRDAQVKFWEYTEPYDDWQGTFGSDAVQAFYHSGHGTMDGNGVFYAPLGAMWDNKDWVNSTQMLLGNERLRYLFWSTCLSLRVLDGQSPIRTWNGRSPGVRMIFGWETVSWDSPVYGRRFWDHWNMRKSFSKAWMDAGWDAGHDQAPSAVGIGGSQAEAQNRVFHEGENLGTLQWGAAAQNWWWWTWYTAARSVAPATTLESVPQQAYVLELGDVSRLLPALDGVGRTDVVGDGLARVELTAQSSAALEVSVPPSDETVLESADRVRSALDLDDIELRGHLVRTQRSAGARADGTDESPGTVSGYVVEYRQEVDGIEVITPQSGYVRVHLDAAGTAMSADVTVRPVDAARRQPVLEPPVAQGDSGTRGADGIDAALRSAQLAHPSVPDDAAPLPGSRRVGYQLSGATAHLGATAGYLVDFGDGLQKKIYVSTALNS